MDTPAFAYLAIVIPTGACKVARRVGKALASGAARVPGVRVKVISADNAYQRRFHVPCRKYHQQKQQQHRQQQVRPRSILRHRNPSTAPSAAKLEAATRALNRAPTVTVQQSLTAADGVLFGLTAPDTSVAGRVRAFSHFLGTLWHDHALPSALVTGGYFLDAPTRSSLAAGEEKEKEAEEKDADDFTLLTYWRTAQPPSRPASPSTPTSTDTQDSSFERPLEAVIADRGEQFAWQLVQAKLLDSTVDITPAALSRRTSVASSRFSTASEGGSSSSSSSSGSARSSVYLSPTSALPTPAASRRSSRRLSVRFSDSAVAQIASSSSVSLASLADSTYTTLSDASLASISSSASTTTGRHGSSGKHKRVWLRIRETMQAMVRATMD